MHSKYEKQPKYGKYIQAPTSSSVCGGENPQVANTNDNNLDGTYLVEASF